MSKIGFVMVMNGFFMAVALGGHGILGGEERGSVVCKKPKRNEMPHVAVSSRPFYCRLCHCATNNGRPVRWVVFRVVFRFVLLLVRLRASQLADDDNDGENFEDEERDEEQEQEQEQDQEQEQEDETQSVKEGDDSMDAVCPADYDNDDRVLEGTDGMGGECVKLPFLDARNELSGHSCRA